MPARQGRGRSLPEISAYVLAHTAGIVWGFAVNPLIFRDLVARGYRDLLLPGIVLSIAITIVELLIFLFLRTMMARVGEPSSRGKFTNPREISAYVLAHAVGLVFGFFVSSSIFRSFAAYGFGDLLLLSIVMSIAVAAAVLLIFLFLRRLMASDSEPSLRGGAIGFGIGLALIAFVLVAVIFGRDKGTFDQFPWTFTLCVAGTLATWIGGLAAYSWTRSQQRLVRVASMTIIVPCMAIPLSAVLLGAALAMAFPTGSRVDGIQEIMLPAIVVGGYVFGIPCLLATAIWSVIYLHLTGRWHVVSISGSG
jgi:hypothetical protein